MARNVRYVFQNPFIVSECNVHSIAPAPINTNIYETYSQCNEDIIVESVLRAQMLRAGRPMESIRYIEIGANHPVQTSSTYLLYRLHGAKGVLVEPIPALAETLQRIRPEDTVVNCAVTTSDAETITLHVHEKNELSSISVDHIAMFRNFGGSEKIVETIACRNMHINAFMKAYAGPYCDYLSVDVEGLDMALISEMDQVFQPTIVQVEHEGRIEQFASLFGTRGYGLLAATDVNAIFIRNNRT